MIQRLLAILVVMITSSCSTVINGLQQEILVETPYAVGAKCWLRDAAGRQTLVSQTPKTVYIIVGDEPLTVSCTHHGFKDTVVTVDQRFELDKSHFGNVFTGGPLSLVVDMTTGAGYHYPSRMIVWMEPLAWDSEASRQSWLLDQKRILQMLAVNSKIEIAQLLHYRTAQNYIREQIRQSFH